MGIMKHEGFNLSWGWEGRVEEGLLGRICHTKGLSKLS